MEKHLNSQCSLTSIAWNYHFLVLNLISSTQRFIFWFKLHYLTGTYGVCLQQKLIPHPPPPGTSVMVQWWMSCLELFRFIWLDLAHCASLWLSPERLTFLQPGVLWSWSSLPQHQHFPTECSRMMDMLYIYLYNTVVTSHVCLLNT